MVKTAKISLGLFDFTHDVSSNSNIHFRRLLQVSPRSWWPSTLGDGTSMPTPGTCLTLAAPASEPPTPTWAIAVSGSSTSRSCERRKYSVDTVDTV